MRKKLLSIYHPIGEVFEYEGKQIVAEEGKQIVAEEDLAAPIDNCCKNCLFFREDGGKMVQGVYYPICDANDLNCVKDDVIYKSVGDVE